LAEDPFSGAVIVYRAKRRDCLKISLGQQRPGAVWKQVRQGSFRWPPIVDGVMTGRSALQGSALARLAVDAMLAGICIDLFEALVPIK
jgi:transposase